MEGFIIFFLLATSLIFGLMYWLKRKEWLALIVERNNLLSRNSTLSGELYTLQSDSRRQEVAHGISLAAAKREAKLNHDDAQKHIEALNKRCASLEGQLEVHADRLRIFLGDKKQSMPWLAGMIADFLTYDLEIEAKKLDWGYNVQREKKVASIRELRAATKIKIQENQEAIYQLAYLRELFPSLDEYLDYEHKDISIPTDLPDSDPVRKYLSKEEWRSLSKNERDQLALDRYVESHCKSKWQIGRDYELSVAYEYSKKGYKVDTFGSYRGIEDLGRDIIAKKPGIDLIIQCKFWSESKTIHEKHIYQLYGTTVSYCIENGLHEGSVRGVFITNTVLSDVAKQAANLLGISVVEKHKMKEFPRIKCNIGRDEHGFPTKIYHLPMDDQYDTTKIDSAGEFYAFTVKEAVEHGFRRAYKWHSES